MHASTDALSQPAPSTASVVAIGELLWDLLPDGARLGGTTANFTILSARLGSRAALVSCVGEDALGDDALAQMRQVADQPELPGALSLEHIQRNSQLPTSTVSVELDATSHPVYRIHQPVAWDAIDHTPALQTLAAQADVLCFGTLAQRSERSRHTLRSMVQGRSSHCVTVCDVNLRMPFCTPEVLRWSLAHAQILKVSDEELPAVAELLGDRRMRATSLAVNDAAVTAPGEMLTQLSAQAATQLLAHAPQCRLVALTLGRHGSVLLADRQHARHNGFAIAKADTVGAGDAFTAGLVYAWRAGAALQAINEIANLCGSYVASQPGATPPLPASLRAQIEHALRA
jgi:fructokinase